MLGFIDRNRAELVKRIFKSRTRWRLKFLFKFLLHIFNSLIIILSRFFYFYLLLSASIVFHRISLSRIFECFHLLQILFRFILFIFLFLLPTSDQGIFSDLFIFTFLYTLLRFGSLFPWYSTVVKYSIFILLVF